MKIIEANIWDVQKEVHLGTWQEIKQLGFKSRDRAFGTLNDGTQALFFLSHDGQWYVTTETLEEIYKQEE